MAAGLGTIGHWMHYWRVVSLLWKRAKLIKTQGSQFATTGRHIIISQLSLHCDTTHRSSWWQPPQPIYSQLQNMLDCCSEFESTYNVKFNPSKSKCITFSQKINLDSPEIWTMLNLTMYNLSSIWDTLSRVIWLMIRTSCIRRPCITERRMQCCQILNTSNGKQNHGTKHGLKITCTLFGSVIVVCPHTTNTRAAEMRRI